ncbi:MAG: GTP cyclohydrolase [Deltaproteobacteria bacterium]|nr:GTP cyclohydrolase [Deltaproteobacteria bacterium]
MKAHVAFLEEQRAAGVFIAWGRKVPRTGGIILARDLERSALEATMQRDPFVSRGLAQLTITEFAAKPQAVVDGVDALLKLLAQR